MSKTTTSEPFLTTTAKGTAVGIAAGATLSSLTGFPGLFGVAAGGVAGAVIGHDISMREIKFEHLSEQLTQRYVQLILLGQQMTFVIQSDRLFYQDSPRIRRSEYPTLSIIAEFIRQFKLEGVHVAAFTNRSSEFEKDLALTEAQAKSVLNYLWREDLGAPVITGLGYGSQSPIANDQSVQGKIDNRRIEIQLQWIAKAS